MKHDFNFIGYIEGSVSRTEAKEIQTHLAQCRTCRRQFEALEQGLSLISTILDANPDALADLSENENDDVDVSTCHGLPAEVKAHLAEDRADLRRQLYRLLGRLTRHGEKAVSDLARELESMVQELGISHSGQTAYALMRDVTLPGQTGLRLREPNGYCKADFDIEQCTIEIKKEDTGNQIRITRDDQPLSGITINFSTHSGQTVTVQTDENGIVKW